jgi:hypothetical protein
VAVGPGYFCTISSDDQSVVCWGTDLGSGESVKEPRTFEADEGLRFKSVGVGLRFLCALEVSGEVYCAGRGYNGELGTGVDELTMGNFSVPVEAPVTFSALSVGAYHACATTEEGDLYCWGDNDAGQLGTGNTESSNVAVKVPMDERVERVSAGGEHTCAVTASRDGYCWGLNNFHQVSPDKSEIILSKSKVNGQWKELFAGFSYTLGIDYPKSHAYGFGLNEIIGVGSASGGYLGQDRAFCLDLKTGEVRCKPDDGSLAMGLATYEDYPVRIGNKKWSSLSPGNVPCGIEAKTKSLFCWGYTAGESYALGSPGTNQPMLVSGGKDWTSISGGIEGTRCGIDKERKVYCWGRNVYDCGGSCPVGDGTQINRAVPTMVTVANNSRDGRVPPLSSDNNTSELIAIPPADAPEGPMPSAPAIAPAPSQESSQSKPSMPIVAVPASSFDDLDYEIDYIPYADAAAPSASLDTEVPAAPQAEQGQTSGALVKLGGMGPTYFAVLVLFFVY